MMAIINYVVNRGGTERLITEFLFRLPDGTSLASLYIRASQSHLTSVFSCRAWNKITPTGLRSRDVKFNVTCEFLQFAGVSCCNLFKTWYISRHFKCDVLQRELFHFSEGRKKVMHGREKCKLLGFPARLLCNWRFIGVFSVSGDRVHISGPDKAQIGGDISLVCSSQESNPPSIIRWTVDGEEQQGTQEEVRTWPLLSNTKYIIGKETRQENDLDK